MGVETRTELTEAKEQIVSSLKRRLEYEDVEVTRNAYLNVIECFSDNDQNCCWGEALECLERLRDNYSEALKVISFPKEEEKGFIFNQWLERYELVIQYINQYHTLKT